MNTEALVSPPHAGKFTTMFSPTFPASYQIEPHRKLLQFIDSKCLQQSTRRACKLGYTHEKCSSSMVVNTCPSSTSFSKDFRTWSGAVPFACANTDSSAEPSGWLSASF